MCLLVKVLKFVFCLLVWSFVGRILEVACLNETEALNTSCLCLCGVKEYAIECVCMCAGACAHTSWCTMVVTDDDYSQREKETSAGKCDWGNAKPSYTTTQHNRREQEPYI